MGRKMGSAVMEVGMIRQTITLILWVFLANSMTWAAAPAEVTASKAEITPMSLEDMNSQMDQVVRQPLTDEERWNTRKKWTPWGVAYFNWATQNVADTENGVGRLGSYNFLAINYSLGAGRKISVRPTFYISGSGNDFYGRQAEAEAEMGDIYIQYINYSLGLLPGDIGVLGKFRLYFPVSENSKRQRNITSVRTWLIFTKPWGRGLETNLHWRPELYIFDSRAGLNEFGAGRANKWGKSWEYFEVAKQMGKNWGFFGNAGVKHEWFYDVPSQGLSSKRNEYYNSNIGGFLNVHPVSLRLSLINEFAIKGLHDIERLYRGEETSYSLMTYVTF